MMTTTDVLGEKAPAEISIADFSSLVANMSRLLTGLAQIAPFSDAKLGLAEWVALSKLAESPGMTKKLLGRRLGVSGERANQISNSLTKSGLISVDQSATASRANEIRITDAGKAQVDAVNSQLMPLLSSALKGKERSLGNAAKQMRHIMRILQTAAPDKQTKKKSKKEKKAHQQEAVDQA